MQKIDFSKLEFDSETESRLFDFCKTHRLGLADVDDPSGLSPKDFNFHVTVMYSKVTNPGFPEASIDLSAPHVLKPISYDLFGPERDLLVLRLEATGSLTGLFEYYRSSYGHVSDFMPYKPHITIRGSSAGARERIESIPLPEFELRAARLVQKVKVVTA